MSALAAKDIEAADLLARLDGNNPPGRCGPPWSHPGRPVPDVIVIATAQEPNDPRPLPETSGGHSAVARSPRHPPVTASRAEIIAAMSGRARQQLTPALTGVG